MATPEHLRSMTGLLNTAKLAKLIDFSQRSIARWAGAGTIPHYRIEGSLRFDPAVIADWLEKRQLAQ